jgi:hypothetical protein
VTAETVVKKMPTQKKGFRITNGQQALLFVKIGDMQQIKTELRCAKWHGIVRYEQEG